MEKGTWSILSNSGGELGRTFIPDRESPQGDMRRPLTKWLEDEGTILCAGDTIKFVEGESETI